MGDGAPSGSDDLEVRVAVWCMLLELGCDHCEKQDY